MAIRTHALSLQLQVVTDAHSPCIQAGCTFCEQGTPSDPPVLPDELPADPLPDELLLEPLELLELLRHGAELLVPHVSPAGQIAPSPWWQQTTVELTQVLSHIDCPAEQVPGEGLDPLHVT